MEGGSVPGSQGVHPPPGSEQPVANGTTDPPRNNNTCNFSP